VDAKEVRLTNLRKIFGRSGADQGGICAVYADVAHVLLRTCAIARW